MHNFICMNYSSLSYRLTQAVCDSKDVQIVQEFACTAQASGNLHYTVENQCRNLYNDTMVKRAKFRNLHKQSVADPENFQRGLLTIYGCHALEKKANISVALVAYSCSEYKRLVQDMMGGTTYTFSTIFEIYGARFACKGEPGSKYQ